MAVHSFDTAVAAEVGVVPAIIFQHLSFWIEKNAADGRHCYEGEFWTYSSVKALGILFPYLTDDQVRRALDRLVATGRVRKGNFNQNPHDRTAWYCIPGAFADLAKSFWQQTEMDLANLPNGGGENAKSYKDTDRSTDRRTDGRTVESARVDASAADPAESVPEKKPRAVKRSTSLPEGWVPSARNVSDALDAGFTMEELENEASRFRDYHLAKGTRFKDWDAGWRTWLRNAREFGSRRSVAGGSSAGPGGRGGGIAGAVARRWASRGT